MVEGVQFLRRQPFGENCFEFFGIFGHLAADGLRLFCQRQLFKSGVVRHAMPLDQALFSIKMRTFEAVERVIENCSSKSFW